MSVSPRQNFWNPPPVPEMPTVTRVPGFGLLKLFRDGFADREHGARTVERHQGGA